MVTVPSFNEEDAANPYYSADTALERASLLSEMDQKTFAALTAPFPIAEHEVHPYHKFIYLKEHPINTRLTEVFGPTGWSKTLDGWEYLPAMEPHVKMGNAGAVIPLSKSSLAHLSVGADGEIVGELPQGAEIIYDIDGAIAWGTMTAGGARRSSIGGDVNVNLGKEPTSRKINTIKAADTDLLKRLARQFGVGLDLTELGDMSIGKKVQTTDDLRLWYHKRYPNDVRFWHPNNAKEQLMIDLERHVPGVYKNGNDVREAALAANLGTKTGDVLNWHLSFVDYYYKILEKLVEHAQGK